MVERLGGWIGVCTTIVKRLPRRRLFIGETGDKISNRGIWHSELITARVEGLLKAPGARGGETDEADNVSGDTDDPVRHTAVYPA